MPGWELIGEEELGSVTRVLASGGVLCAYGFDEHRRAFAVRDFEHAFASRLAAPCALAVSSGTAALKVALDALGVGPGDDVVTSSFGFVATVEAILATGARPVVAEIDDTLCMDPTDVAERCMTERTRAILPVHMLGGVADMQAIAEVAAAFALPIVEDAAQALGAQVAGRSAGTMGDLGAFSFDAAKTMTTGEGGMVVTADPRLFARSRAAHDHGHDHRQDRPRYRDTHSTRGFNFRMSELQAAVGLAQLGKLDRVLEAQRRNWQLLTSHLPPGVRLRRLPAVSAQTHDTIAVILASAADAVETVERLRAHGIGTWVVPGSTAWHFAGEWDHLLPGVRPDSFPRSWELLSRTVAFHVPVRLHESYRERWATAWR